MPFPVDQKYITETEIELKVKFPPKFKNRMRKSNGGELVTDDFEFELYPFFDKSDKKRVSRTCNHIGLETKNAREWSRFPENGIAIGSDGYGNLLILTHMEKGLLADYIYYWNHKNGEITKIAESIDNLED